MIVLFDTLLKFTFKTAAKRLRVFLATVHLCNSKVLCKAAQARAYRSRGVQSYIAVLGDGCEGGGWNGGSHGDVSGGGECDNEWVSQTAVGKAVKLQEKKYRLPSLL